MSRRQKERRRNAQRAAAARAAEANETQAATPPETRATGGDDPIVFEDRSLPPFQRFRRKSIAELRPYVPGESLERISVGDNCEAAGGPVAGDMVARDPKNHADQWIVIASYFREHFEPEAT